MKLSPARSIDVASLALSSEQTAVRSPGLHVSSIIRHISRSLGKQKGKDFTEADLDQFAIVGRLWEAQLAAAMFKPPRYERIGEIERDGIVGSPDCIDTEDLAVMEFKVSWASAKHPVEERRAWWWQIAAYCYMLELQKAQLYVFYVNGEYHPPVPIARAWDVIFGWRELQDNWQMLIRNSKELL